jgi:hypothetical protein
MNEIEEKIGHFTRTLERRISEKPQLKLYLGTPQAEEGYFFRIALRSESKPYRPLGDAGNPMMHEEDISEIADFLAGIATACGVRVTLEDTEDSTILTYQVH